MESYEPLLPMQADDTVLLLESIKNEEETENPQVHVNFCLDKTSASLLHSAKESPAETEKKGTMSLRESWTKKVQVLTRLASLSAKRFLSNEPAGKSESKTKSFKPCPSFKVMPGTKFVVDAFAYGPLEGITGYFLTHFHSDHYFGLRKDFNYGTLYCTAVTANLIEHQIKVDPFRIVRLPYGKKITIDDVKVTLLDANHCPGSAIIIFELPSGAKYLHTGDFRASENLLQLPEICLQHFDKVYLDNTYGANEIYKFPSQDEVIERTVAIIREKLHNDKQMRLVPVKYLILVGTYLIGKERILIGIAKSFNWKIYADRKKRKIFECLGWQELSELLTDDPHSTPLHVGSMGKLNETAISEYLESFFPKFTHALSFRPTGWSFSKDPKLIYEPQVKDFTTQKFVKKNSIFLYSVPYSEHSSYSELQNFIKSICAKEIIPTVN